MATTTHSTPEIHVQRGIFSRIVSLFAAKPLVPSEAEIEKGRSGARAHHPVERYYAHKPTHPSQGLTPSAIMALLDRADNGDVSALAELISDIFDKEPTIYALHETRLESVVCKQWEVIPISEEQGRNKSKAAKEQAAWLTDVLKNLSLWDNRQTSSTASEFLTFEELQRYLLSAIPYGFATAFLEWDTDEWIVKAAKAVEHKHFRFGDINLLGQADYNPRQLRFLTVEEPARGVELQPNQAITHFFKNRPVLPGRFGLIRTLAYWYMFKSWGVKSMLQYAERFGQPLTIGYYDPNTQTGDTDKDAVAEAVRELGTDAAAVLSRAQGESASKVEFVQPQGTTDVHSRLIALVNDEFAKAILGHASAAEATPGKLGEQTDSIEAQNYRIESDARALEATINEQLLKPMAVFRDGRLYCKFKIRYEREESQNEKAKRYQTLSTIPGFAMPVSHLYETFNIPEPEEDEPVTTAPGQDPAMAAVARQAAKSAAEGAAKSAAASARTHDCAAHGHSVHANGRPAQTLSHARNPRHALAVAEQERIAADARESALEAAPVYAALLDGVTLDNYRDALQRNVKRFRSDFRPIAEKALTSAGARAFRSFGGAAKFDGKSRRWNIEDDAARDFVGWQSFSLTVIEGEMITAALRDKIGAAVRASVNEGLTLKQFMDYIADSTGITATNPYHMETVFRTNMGTAANASKLFGLAQNGESFPAWQFLAVEDTETTTECLELTGRVFPASDTANWPPLHFNCRSMAVPISREEMDAEGLEAEPGVSPMGQDGFTNTAVANYSAWVNDMAAGNSAIQALLNNGE